MWKSLLTLVVIIVLAIPATALASTPTPQHIRKYNRLRHELVQKDGLRSAGRNIVKDGLTLSKPASDFAVIRSIGVMKRMLNPVVVPQIYEYEATTPSSTVAPTTDTSPVTETSSVTPTSGLESCIIYNESRGNADATNGQYAGVGQWSPTAWAADGGTQYGASPLDATKAEQESVLSSEGEAGMQSQQGDFDGC